MNDLPRKDPMLRANLRFCLLALAGTALVMGGCGAQADSSYRGTPLAQLHGSVQTSASSGATSAPPALEAALLWSGNVPGADAKASVSRREVGTSVPVTGQFPAQFALQIYTPPPDAALFPCGAGAVATAQVAALIAGTAATSVSITDLYGIDRDFIVVYADRDLVADSRCVVSATKGYHLFKYAATPDKPGCVRGGDDDPKCNGPWPFTEVPMTTDLTLVLSHEDGKATPPPAPNPPASTAPAPPGP